MTLCPVCGADPCYRICPTQDPFGGDQAAENADYEFNARYDDVRERYAATAEDAAIPDEYEYEYPDLVTEVFTEVFPYIPNDDIPF